VLVSLPSILSTLFRYLEFAFVISERYSDNRTTALSSKDGSIRVHSGWGLKNRNKSISDPIIITGTRSRTMVQYVKRFFMGQLSE